MALCGNCGSESVRVRSRWTDGKRLPDECPNCSPESFDGKFTMPSDKKIWMGYEVHPNEYVKSEDGGFDRKPEYRAEQEAQLALGAADEREAQLMAEEKKRRERRTEPMNSSEMLQALAKARAIADALQQSMIEGIDAAN